MPLRLRDYTPNDFDAIWQLDPKLGPLSRRELAERLHCDPSNVTFLVDRLESRRLLTRARARSDRRTQALALTPAGIEVRERLIRTIADSSMFTTLTRAQQRQLVDLLQRASTPDSHRAEAQATAAAIPCSRPL